MLDPKFLATIERVVAPAPRHVLFVTGSRTFGARRDGQAWFLREFAPVTVRVPPGTLYLNGGCPDSPDVWGWGVLCFQLRKDRGTFAGLTMRGNGWYAYHEARSGGDDPVWSAVHSDRWTLRPGDYFDGPDRNGAMAEALVFLKRLGCSVEAHAFTDGFTPGTRDMLERLAADEVTVAEHAYAVSP